MTRPSLCVVCLRRPATTTIEWFPHGKTPTDHLRCCDRCRAIRSARENDGRTVYECEPELAWGSA